MDTLETNVGDENLATAFRTHLSNHIKSRKDQTTVFNMTYDASLKTLLQHAATGDLRLGALSVEDTVQTLKMGNTSVRFQLSLGSDFGPKWVAFVSQDEGFKDWTARLKARLPQQSGGATTVSNAISSADEGGVLDQAAQSGQDEEEPNIYERLIALSK